MNRTMCLMATGALVASASAAIADGPELQPIPADWTATKIQPTRISKVLGRNADGTFIFGESIPYEVPMTDGAFPPVIYDAYEGAVGVCQGGGTGTDLFPANGSASGGVDPACDFGVGYTGACNDGDTTRWWFGPSTKITGHLQRLNSFAAGASSTSTVTHVDFAWTQLFGSGDSSPCQGFNAIGDITFIIQGFEDPGDWDINNPADYDLANLVPVSDGVGITFANVPPGAGYYFTNVDLSTVPFDVVEGGLLLIFATHFDPFVGEDVPTDSVQMMLWGPKDSNAQGAVDQLGYLDGFGPFDTSNCADGIFTAADEGLDGAIACPAPNVQAMIDLRGEPGVGGPLCMTSGNWQFGSSESGTVGDTCGSDDVRWTSRPQAFAANLAQLLTANMSTVTTNNAPNSISVTVEASIDNSNVNDVSARLQIWNFDSSSWETIAFPPLTTTDLVISGSPTGLPADYVDQGTGEVRIRVQFFRNGPGNWTGRIDDAFVDIQ